MSRLAVYFDPKAPTSWIPHHVAERIAELCEALGAIRLDRNSLPSWLSQEEGGRLLVFAQDCVPEEAIEPLRRFLEAGNIVLWLGDIPFYYVAAREGRQTPGPEGSLKFLGFYAGDARWDQGMATPTAEGERLGILPYESLRPTKVSNVDEVLARSPDGDASSWVKRVGAGLFVRLLDRPLPSIGVEMLTIVIAIAELASRLGVELAIDVAPLRELARRLAADEESRATFDALLPALVELRGARPALSVLARRKPVEELLRSISAEIEAAFRERGVAEVYWIGQSHIDWAWLWVWEETIKKCIATFSQALEHMKRWPEFRYAQSTPAYYKWMEKHNPELFKKISQAVAEGRWELVGGEWVEHDCHIPCGESLIRQRLYGQRYYLSRFGRISKVAWLPDTFGFCWTLPQILVKSGQKYFLTVKLDWSYVNKFPFRVFRWRSPDGSEVIACNTQLIFKPTAAPSIIDEFRGRSPLLERSEVFSYTKLPDNIQARDRLPLALFLYGRGDGGLGPTKDEANAGVVLRRNLARVFSLGPVERFFEAVERFRERLPVWDDELYLENHRGTYSAQWIIKYLNRRAECQLISAERLCSIALALGEKYPKEELEQAWKWVLSYQWHDPLPGSAIRAVYEEAERDFKAHVFPAAERAISKALEAIARRVRAEGEGSPLLVFNVLSWPRRELVELEGSFVVRDERGRRVPSQIVELEGRPRTLFIAELPPLGYRVYFLEPAEPAPGASRWAEAERREASIEGSRYRVGVRDGKVVSILDKELGVELLRAPIEVVSYKCEPHEWDNWNIMPGYWQHKTGEFEVERLLVLRGPLLSAVRMEGSLEGSPMTWEARVYHGLDRVDFLLKVDWRVSRRIVKMWFPVSIDADYCYASIPFGVYPRPFRPRNRYERERWEFPHQKWVCISDGRLSVTIANWTRYGSGIINGVYGLTLIKNGVDPDPKCDLYEHEFRISLRASAGEWRAAMPWRLGEELNYPPLLTRVERADGDLPAAHSFLELTPDWVVIENIKRHEDSDSLVFHLYDAAGLGGEALLRFNAPLVPEAAEEMDFLELNTLRGLRVEGSTVRVPLRPWEIKCVRVSLKGVSRA